ncbi:SAM-dependent methyltransferase [Streptomyces sp. NPDC058644]|uniref:SAM-dependent methyltransferase n=1 Tax=Streptomyces sp. NPDC058644 TaxID=3346573 RepID=UPI00365A97CB
MRVPERLTAAVELLGAGPDDRVLEIGCGRGVAAALICERLVRGRLLGIDRSAAAIAAARERNAAAIASGRARFVRAVLADVRTAPLGTYDKILACDVNVFWTGPATRELAIVSALLAPGGVLLIACTPPPGRPLGPLEEILHARLRQAGLRTTAWGRAGGGRADPGGGGGGGIGEDQPAPQALVVA